MSGVLTDILCEQVRQEELLADGKITVDCTNPLTDMGAKLAVLIEEVGEVARAICEKDTKNLREELIQVSAVAASMAQGVPEDEDKTGEPLVW